MPSDRQSLTIDKYVNIIHELMMDQINGIRSGAARHYRRNRHVYVRMFGQLLYEAPKLHTGYVSVKMVEQKLADFRTRPCQEHHHSRQNGGKALVRLIDTAVSQGVDPTKQHIRDIALQYCQVHYTTVGENALLRRQQRKCSSEAAYRRSGIQLIKAGELFTHKGRHTEAWKAMMRKKYQPIVDATNDTSYPNISVDLPVVIN